MSRLEIASPKKAKIVMEGLYKDLERRIESSPPGLCPVDMARAFLELCHAQTCGKCVPCRIGLGQLNNFIREVLDGKATMKTLDIMEQTALSIMESADCAIGYEAANMVYKGLIGYRDDYVEHIQNGRCTCTYNQPVPCVSLCPAHVDIPGYVALVGEGRYADAIRLLRKDNPFPTTCGFICEHPCEARCRRNMVDDSINIRGLKRVAADFAGEVEPPKCAPSTGKKIAVLGGGPGGLSAAYYLSLMGHKVTIFEQRKQLGGMLRYGIPNYRLPRTKLDEDINAILSTGIEVKKNISVGTDITLEDINKEYDAIYISIGAHADKKIGIDGEDAKIGVTSAVEMLRAIGDDEIPDYTGKKVVVIGGGNVAMDVARSSVRLGAEKVSIVYRRRKEDMTALEEEVAGAEAEGCDILELMSPVRIEKDKNDKVVGLWVQPQMISKIKGGRPSPKTAAKDEVLIPCDLIVVAIGQGIETRYFEEHGVTVKRGTIEALATSEIKEHKGIFAGGDCVTGPATVIRAIAAGKVAAANIDDYLGFHHEITCDVEIPYAGYEDKIPCGRVEVAVRDAADRKKDFEPIEYGFSCEEACQESGRCLRCDHFGFGSFRGGREEQW